MSQYFTAVYANENLVLSEVLERLENDFPLMGVSVFGNSLANTTITTATNEYDVLPAGMIKNEDILIILSDPKDDLELLKKFDGDVIDFTGASTAEDVYTIEEPLAYIINRLKVRPEDMEAVALLPAALFGKSGIDDLITQTRELFAFSNTETKVFDERLAFNMFFSDKENGLLAGYRQKLLTDTGVDADVRLAPVSTGFVLDVYFKKDVNKEFSNITDTVGFVSALSDVTALPRPIVVGRTPNRLSIAGDYIRLICGQISEAVKEITGE